MMTRWFTPFRSAGAVLVLLIAGATAFAQPGVSTAPGGILVQGSGVVMGEPDVVVVTLGVDMVDADLAAALASADAAMAAVHDVLTAAGVAETDIQTSAFNIWREDVRDDDGTVTAARYHVSHSYQVTVRELEDIGTLLPAAVEAGANNVGGIQFTISDPTALESQARAAAMEDAQVRASELAEAAGVRLGAPVSIEEQTSPQPRPTVAFARAAESSPIAAGQLAVRVDVTVRFGID